MSAEPDTRAVLVSIIILTKNGERHLRALLDGLYDQPGIDRAEVIIIDSGSTDASLSIAADFPATRVVEIPAVEFGHGKTRNLGARLARGDYLVYLPQDATPMDREWLANLLRPFDKPEVAGVFGRQVARSDASPMERFFLSHTYPERVQIKTLGGGEEGSLTQCFFSTVSGAVRRSVWARHAFREDIIMSEDQAWAADVMREGHAIAYEPSASVLHSHAYGIGEIFRRNFDSGYSIWQIFGGATGITPGRALANLASETLFVAKHGSVIDWLRFLPYEAARHAGFWLGLRADRLPVRVSRACSSLKYFWDERAAARGLRT